MMPCISSRYRNCVYTYRILPNEDDRFTVQVSCPTDEETAPVPCGMDLRARLSVLLPEPQGWLWGKA